VYMFDVPMAMKDTISVACGGQRSGSGVRGLKAELLNEAEAAIPGGSSTETATDDLLIQNVAVPAGDTLLHLRVSAASQATDVTSDFYRCGIHFQAAQ
jgi:hypothetical protein